MFKRMSILVRRPDDDRDSFAAKWEFHGTLVSQLPLIRTYLQNHVVEAIPTGGAFDADGIVELRFDRPEDMATAFASPNAAAVKADEPGFLGHGTGYALQADTMPLVSPDGGKLIVVCGKGVHPSHVDHLLTTAAAAPGFLAATRDDVASVIARNEMERPPQWVSTFVHLLFSDPESATAAGVLIAAGLTAEAGEDASVVRVRTKTAI
jgi:uncharacterized protein (TIGR02118 family)